MPRRGPRVFICYCRRDLAYAERLYDHLLEAGALPWMDKKNLVAGDQWEQEIEKAVAQSDAFVVCLSRRFDRSGVRQKEVKLGLRAFEKIGRASCRERASIS